MNRHGLSRRKFLGLSGLAAMGLTAACTRDTRLNPAEWQPPATLAPTPTARPQEAMTPDAALIRLIEGNRRFMSGNLIHPDYGPERREAVAREQMPFAAILSCADSRVPPEVVFDHGLGDLFVVRVAGNVLSSNIVASLEYAVEHLHTPLVVVLGHKKCGAVKASVETIAANAEAPGHIASLVAAIGPAVAAARIRDGDTVDIAIRENVLHVVNDLPAQSPALAEMVENTSLRIIGGYYDLDSGEVEMLTV